MSGETITPRPARLDAGAAMRAARDAAIVQDYVDSGRPLREIAAHFQLTPERVRQILAREGVLRRRAFRNPR